MNRGYTSKLPFPTAILSHKIALMAYKIATSKRFQEIDSFPRISSKPAIDFPNLFVFYFTQSSS